ncbi:ATP-binding protein [Flindersiella endophytica]
MSAATSPELPSGVVSAAASVESAMLAMPSNRPSSEPSVWCLGRENELEAIGRVLQDKASAPRAVVLEGEAGIGKSTVWGAGLAHAMRSGYLVLSTRASQSETALSFAGLSDLFAEVVDDVLPHLPEPQRVALEVALLRRSPGRHPSSRRAVGAAALSALRRLCSTRRVLLAIDDVPWLDRATADTLRFALRRLRTEPLRLLVTRRIADGLQAAPADGAPLQELVPVEMIERRRLGPLDAKAIGRLLDERLGAPLPAQSVRLLAERTAGNPFWALEVGAALAGNDAGDDSGSGELPVPGSLSALVAERVAAISSPAREALLVVSALSHPPASLVLRALAGVVPDPPEAIDDAVLAGVVSESAGRLRPSHPLLGSAALDRLPRSSRAALHRRLAAVVSDPEQHARHLALAGHGGPDAKVATALDVGAEAARIKGAGTAAVELAELAISFTPPDLTGELARRRMRAAELLFGLGELEGAEAHAAAVRRTDVTADEYRRLLPMYVEATFWHQGRDAAQALVRQAVDESGDDRHLHAVALAMAADVGDGRTSQLELTRQALAEFDRVPGEPDPVGLITALVMQASLRLSAGEGLDYALVERAEAVEQRAPWMPLANRPSVIRGFWLRVVEDLDGARSALTHTLTCARRHGDEGALPVLLGHLALTECWAGRYAEAAEAADEGLRRIHSGELTTHVLHAARGLLYALTGDLTAASTLMEERLGGTTRPADDHQALHYLPVLGQVAWLRGNSRRSVELISRALAGARRIGWLDPGRRLHPEATYGQALIDIGRLDEASDLVDELRSLSSRSSQPRPMLLGLASRLDGLVHAARGDLDASVPLLERAVVEHARSQFPLEHGRSLLALGQVHRRRRAKPQARRAFEGALECFTRLGARPFADLAQAELDRVHPGRAGAALTKTERRVAELVAAGLTNREVAAQLFSSVRTVEGHLAAAYRKLGVRSRTELARAMPSAPVDRGGQPAPPET